MFNKKGEKKERFHPELNSGCCGTFLVLHGGEPSVDMSELVTDGCLLVAQC